MTEKKKGASKPKAAVAAATNAEAVAPPASKPKKPTKAEVAAATAANDGAAAALDAPSFELGNGRVVDFVAVRKAIKVYSPKSKIPTDDAAALQMLRDVLAVRLAEVAADDKLLCGEEDDATTGCREMATSDTSFCPFCGDEGVDGGTATENGLVAQKAELDEALSRFESLRRDFVANAYDIGLTLRDIRDRDLWKASGATSLKDFMEKELGISRTSGFRYMALTEEYDRKTFIEIGPRKLELISGIDTKEAREEALAAAKAGATTRDVEALARPARTRGEAPAREGKGSNAPAKPKGGAEITLLAKVNGKAQMIPFRGAESGRPLKMYKDGSYGELQISDDVVLRVGLKGDSESGFEGMTIAFVRAT